MSERGAFYRKIAYLIGVAVLLFPIAWLGAPATLEDDGGQLSQLRDEYNLLGRGIKGVVAAGVVGVVRVDYEVDLAVRGRNKGVVVAVAEAKTWVEQVGLDTAVKRIKCDRLLPDHVRL